MNAVNLLPAKHRPRQSTGGKQGSSYFLLIGLGLVVAAVLVYVVTLNSINSATSQVAQANGDAARANAQADALGAYGDFAKVKQERVTTVKQLAEGRADWERVVRELARLLPSGVWITNANASDSSTSNGASATGTSGAAAAASSAPQVILQGCAVSQPAVADTLVRLREMQGATDVSLDHSTKPDDTGAAASGTSGGSSGGCGKTNGSSNFDFQATVTLEKPSSTASAGNVPASLGGGQ